MKNKKILSFVLAAALTASAVAMTGCSNSPADSSEGESQKVLKVGMECAYAPYNWTQSDDSNGAVEISNAAGSYANGYDIKIAKKLCEEAGYLLEVVKMDWDGLAPGITSGKIDAIIAGMSPTEERKQTIDFTDPYYQATVFAVVQADGSYANAKTAADFNGAVATSQQNTYWYDKMLDQLPGIQKQTALSDVPTCVTSLNANKIDLFLTDKPTAQAAVTANKNLKAIDLSKDSSLEVNQEDIDISIGIKKGSTELADALNAGLEKLSQEDRDALMQEAIEQQPVSE